jgi:hypothetical protein
MKAVLAALAALAIAVGFAMPGAQGDEAQARSQIPTLDLG